MYVIRMRWDLASDGSGFMVYLVYRRGNFQSAHMSRAAAESWVANQS